MPVSKTPLDRSRLTFSQAEGIVPLPSQLQFGEMSVELRSVLWANLVERLRETSYRHPRMRPAIRLGGSWSETMYDAHVLLYHKPADEFDSSLDHILHIYKTLILNGAFNEIFDFIQFVMRHRARPYDFVGDMRRILHQCRAAYTVINDGPTIIPVGSEEEVKTLVDAFAATKHEAFPGAGAHLRLAVEALNSGRYGDSVRESVHAVESAARVLSEDAKATLAPALQQLDTRLKMHPAFKKALVSLYGYTSDEGGNPALLARRPNACRYA